MEQIKKIQSKELKKFRFFTYTGMKIIITIILLGFIGYNTTVKPSNQGVWYTILGNLTAYWFPSSKDEDENDDEKDEQQKLKSN